MRGDIEKLIGEMQEVKAAHPTLTISEVLRLFNIAATQELTNVMRRKING